MRLLAQPKTGEGSQVQAEDAKVVVDSHLDTWYQNTRWGIEKANLAGSDDAMTWFLIALGGNLVWAATAFVNPTAAIAIRAMSVAGATIGSGTAQQLFAEEKPIEEFKQIVIKNFSDRYKGMQRDVALTMLVKAEFEQRGLMNRDDATQAQQRREAAWQVMFKDTVPFRDPSAIEQQAKKNVEAIWAAFLPTYNSYYTIVTPSYIRADLPKYILGAFYRALVVTGIADQLSEVKKEQAYEKDGDQLRPAGTSYLFPGGVRVRRGPKHDWFDRVRPEINTIQ
ncbi:MAG: hypothetical protein ACR2H2_18935 [Solirubrobacteraceae bacterium]